MRWFKNFVVTSVMMFGCLGAFANTAKTPRLSFPGTSVKLIVPVAPGGVSGQIAQTLAKSLSLQWETEVTVEHWVGDSGNTGVTRLAKMPADGNWILLTAPHVLINPLTNPNAGYNMLQDFAAVTNVISSPHAIAIHPSLPVKTLPELVALLKLNPGKYSYSSAGTGSMTNLTCKLLQETQGLDVRHIPYDGGGPAVKAVLEKQADITCSPLSIMLAPAKTGNLKLLAVTSHLRSRTVPEVPTTLESGHGYLIVESMQGIFVPTGTPPEVIGRIRTSIQTAMKSDATKAEIEKAGHLLVTNSSTEFSLYAKVESARWRKFLKLQNQSNLSTSDPPITSLVK
jgi:tripartite-type tricarboxylate transporter receptor subunit TctC